MKAIAIVQIVLGALLALVSPVASEMSRGLTVVGCAARRTRIDRNVDEADEGYDGARWMLITLSSAGTPSRSGKP